MAVINSIKTRPVINQNQYFGKTSRNQSLLESHYNSLQNANETSFLENNIFQAFGKKVKEAFKFVIPDNINTERVKEEAKLVDREISNFVESGQYELMKNHNDVRINYII